MSKGESGRIVTYDTDTGTYRTAHDFTRRSSLCATLIVTLEEVASAEGVELGRPLHDAIDPDGLELLFEPTRRTPRDVGWVTFAIDGFGVTVHASGDIVITPPGDG